MIELYQARPCVRLDRKVSVYGVSEMPEIEFGVIYSEKQSQIFESAMLCQSLAIGRHNQ